MKLLSLLALVLLARFYALTLGVTCPHEAMNSNLMGFTVINETNGNNENQMCLTVVPLFYAVDLSADVTPYEKSIDQLQSYCRENFLGGDVMNKDALIGYKIGHGNIRPRRNVTALTADVYKMQLIGSIDPSFKKVLAYRSTFFNGLQVNNTENCIFDLKSNAFTCKMFSGFISPVSEIMRNKEPYCLMVNVNDFQPYGRQSNKFNCKHCESAMYNPMMNFLCMHRAYRDCVYWKKETKCTMNYETGACLRTVNYQIIHDGEFPYGQRCPENTSISCDCSEISDGDRSNDEHDCYNGGVLILDNGKFYCQCPMFYTGSKCQMVSIYGQYTITYEIVVFFTSIAVALILFILWCVMHYRCSKRRINLKISNTARAVRIPVILRRDDDCSPLTKKGEKSANLPCGC